MDAIVQIFTDLLWPVVDSGMSRTKGPGWAEQLGGGVSVLRHDAGKLVGVFVREWYAAFDEALPSVCRTYAYEMKEWRNKLAHGSFIEERDVVRAADTARRFAEAVGAPDTEAFEEFGALSAVSETTAQSATGPEVNAVTESTAGENDLFARVLKFVATQPGCSAREIAAGVKADKSDVNSVLYAGALKTFRRHDGTPPTWFLC